MQLRKWIGNMVSINGGHCQTKWWSILNKWAKIQEHNSRKHVKIKSINGMENGRRNLGKGRWGSRHLMGGNHQDEWKAATWELHSHQDKSKGEEITLTQAHTNCAKFLYFIQFNMKIQWGRSPIYRWRSLGEQAWRVGWETLKRGQP